jgi:NitT/TauT family transport system substrate-binding protein
MATKLAAAAPAFTAILIAIAAPAAVAAEKVSLAVPGVPPVFSGLVAYVAREEGFFQKQGVDVEVRPFDSGAAAAQAVVTGNIDVSLSPTPVIVRMVSNAGVDLVGVYGMANPDWLLASTEPGVKCPGLQDQAIGVDSVGGARAVALAAFLHACGLKVDQVKLVALSSNVGAAMIAGQIKIGVLHTDDVPVIEEQLGKKLSIVSTFQEVAPVSHYNLLVVTRKTLQQKRPAIARVVAALVEATRFMVDPKNADRVANIATVTGRSAQVAKQALPHFYRIKYWPLEDDGMGKANLDRVIATEKEVGGIKPGKEPVAVDRLVDRGVWKEAQAFLNK